MTSPSATALANVFRAFMALPGMRSNRPDFVYLKGSARTRLIISECWSFRRAATVPVVREMDHEMSPSLSIVSSSKAPRSITRSHEVPPHCREPTSKESSK